MDIENDMGKKAGQFLSPISEQILLQVSEKNNMNKMAYFSSSKN